MANNFLQQATVTFEALKARAKFLAREDRLMRSELVRIRRDLKLTQREVAELMGVSQQAVNKFERYDSDPRLSTIRRYSNAIGAIVEHRVTVDRGHSLLVVNGRSWENAGQLGDMHLTLPASQVSELPVKPRSAWSAVRRTDFARAA